MTYVSIHVSVLLSALGTLVLYYYCTQHRRTVYHCEVWCYEVITTSHHHESYCSRWAAVLFLGFVLLIHLLPLLYYYIYPSTNILSGCGGLDPDPHHLKTLDHDHVMFPGLWMSGH